MSVRGTRTTPDTKQQTDHGTRTKITSGLMNSLNWARPFRKSREEDGKVVTKSMTRRDIDSLSPRSSHQFLSSGNLSNLSRTRNTTSNSRVAPLTSNLGTSNTNLKRSTSSVSSLTPTKVIQVLLDLKLLILRDDIGKLYFQKANISYDLEIYVAIRKWYISTKKSEIWNFQANSTQLVWCHSNCFYGYKTKRIDFCHLVSNLESFKREYFGWSITDGFKP